MERLFKPIRVSDLQSFKRRILGLSDHFEHFCLLESNDYDLYPHSNFGFFAGIGSIAELVSPPGEDLLENLGEFHRRYKDWMFGYFSYDLKNQIETQLTSGNPDHIHCPPGHFFIPKFLLRFHETSVDLGVTDETHREEFNKLLSSSGDAAGHPRTNGKTIELKARIDKGEYIRKVEGLKEHIQRGDIYETNFCMEFYMENTSIDPVAVFEKLNRISRAPFGAYFRHHDLYLLCSSPERYLKKWQQTVVSQPIKGTIRRGNNPTSDSLLKEALRWDPKERSENVMIVDLVRNDLSRVAHHGSVEVEELFGVYTFEQVHQMISTVVCQVDRSMPFTEIIRATFPMGSMTGAPKFRAMQLIEEYETVQRGLYSGAVGYITPQANFDFNVVIRSILHNAANKYTSVQVGSALTIECNAEYEYNECLLKAKAMREALRAG
jgi:para-aminobenzoate synthetase component 1